MVEPHPCRQARMLAGAHAAGRPGARQRRGRPDRRSAFRRLLCSIAPGPQLNDFRLLAGCRLFTLRAGRR
jgi:hypothetical protein